MPEASQIKFSYKELAEILVKQQGIHEGYWSIYMRFGLNAVNVSLNEGAFFPSAVIPVIEVGINRDPELMPLGVDAAEVNPAPETTKHSSKKKKTG
jgi:hypothetical protein